LVGDHSGANSSGSNCQMPILLAFNDSISKQT
jgi:hypothetical protein